jgi:Tfp pilus assembly protein PilV
MVELKRKKATLFHKKLKASSIIEVMVATVLISIALFVVIHLFQSISTTERTPLKTAALLELNTLMHTLNASPQSVQESYPFQGYNIQVRKLAATPGTITLEFQCVDLAGQSFYQIQKTYLQP